MKKILSLILIFSLILTSSVNIFTAYSADIEEASINDNSLKEVISPYDLLSYNAISNYKNNISDIEGISVSNQGIDGSYGLVIEGDGSYHGTYLRFDENIGTKFLASDKTYTMKLSAKAEGAVSDLKYGIRMHSSFFTDTPSVSSITDEWQEFSYTFTPTTTATDYWVHMYIAYTIPNGSTLYIDNITVYDETDETQTNLFTKGSFDSKPHYESKAIDEENLIASCEPLALTDYNPSWSGTGTDVLNNLTTVSIAENEGINETCALKLSEGTYNVFAKFANVNNTAAAYFKAGETYRIGFKAKKQGSVENFSFKIKTTSTWKTYTLFTAAITDNWVYYAADLNFDDYALTGEGYKHWGISCTVNSDSHLLIDDIEIYNIKDISNVNIYTKGCFEKDADGWNRLEGETQNASFNPKYVTDYSGNGFTAEVIPIDKAISGNNVLAIGFDDHYTNGRVYFELAYIRPRASYKLEMYVMPIGDIDESVIYINDCDSNSGDTDNHPPESTIIYNYYSESDSYPYPWIKIETKFTDLTTSEGSYRWSGINISLKGESGCGLLIDSVSIKTTESSIENPPNIFADAGFEAAELPEVIWSDKYFGEDINDLSFMNSLPKTMGELGNGLKTEYNQYLDIVDQNGDFSYLNMAIISTQNTEIALYETKKALENNKEVWLDATYIVSYGIDESSGAVYDDWQARLDKIAYNMQLIAGDRFQGIYFDEPHLKFRNNDEFAAVTKYIRENYKKRVFSMAKHDMFDISETSSANVTITAESHKYVTDIGYWNYSSSGMSTRSSGFNDAVERLSPDVRKWICCLMGQTDTVVTEEENISMFTHMLNAAKTNKNFGGVLLWDAYDTDGYGMLKTNEDGSVKYSRYRLLLTAVSEDFTSAYSWLNDPHTVNSDNIITVSDEYLTVEAFKNSFDSSLQEFMELTLYGFLTAPSSLKVTNSNIKLTVNSLTSSDTRELKFALANDVNGDGVINIADVVRAKKISAGTVSATATSYAAAGTTVSEGITAHNISTLRNLFLG